MTSNFGVLILALLQGVAGTSPSGDTATPTPSTVIAVIVPSATNLPMVDALTRLRGEAASVGFEVRLVESRAGVEPVGQLDLVARELMPAAVVALVEKPDTEQPAGTPIGIPVRTIDVWFLDRTTGKTSIGHLSVDAEAGDRADLVLAVRVVDFIRARMFDSLVRTLALAKDRQRKVTTHATVGRRTVAVGLVGTGSFSGFSPAFLPFLEIGYGVRPWLRLTLGAGALGSEPRRVMVRTAGSATMDQTLGVASVYLMAPVWWRLGPYAQTGASLLYVAVHGEGDSGYLGHDRSAWSPGWFAAAGVLVTLSQHIVLQLSGGAMLLLHEPKVFIAGVEVARTGRPAWLCNTLLGVTF